MCKKYLQILVKATLLREVTSAPNIHIEGNKNMMNLANYRAKICVKDFQKLKSINVWLAHLQAHPLIKKPQEIAFSTKCQSTV